MPFMRAFKLPVLVLLGCAALPLSSAPAAGNGRAKPSVTPAGVGVGDTLTIRGRNLLAGKTRSSIAFRRSGRPVVSVKASTATATRITVVVPAALGRSLTIAGGVAQPTRFGVRVRARAMSKWYTEVKRSALVGPTAGAPGALGSVGPPAHCTPGAAQTLGDVFTDVLYSLDGGAGPDGAIAADDPVEKAAEKKLCAGAAATADDPAGPDMTGPGIDPDDDPAADPGDDVPDDTPNDTDPPA